MSMRRLEQTRAAKWDPLDYHATNGLGADEVVPANFPVVITNLDIPLIGTNTVRATNTTTITLVYTNLKMVRVDCVWSVLSRGPFTDTVITYRAPDQ